MAMQVFDSRSKLFDEQCDSTAHETLFKFELGLVSMIEQIFVSGELCDKVDIVLIIEEGIDLCDVGMKEGRAYFNLS